MEENNVKIIDDSMQSTGVTNNGQVVQKKLPGAVGVMIMGIVGLATAFIYGIGIIFSLIAKSKYKKNKAVYDTDPEAYAKDYKFCEIGRKLATAGFWVSIGMLALVVFLVVAIIIDQA
jgi:hypothetical protein